MANNLIILHVFLLAMTFGGCFSQNSLKESRTEVTNQDEIIRLRHPMEYKSPDPSKVIQLSWQPRVFMYMNFLSNEECDYLISRVHDEKRQTARGNDLPDMDTSKIPTNFNIPLDADDEITRRIEERISAWTFLPKENSLPLRILHLGSEDSKQNYNYFKDKSAGQVNQPLCATVILYLSDVSHGGQIIFPHSNNKILSDCTKSSNTSRPHKGNAIVFFNMRLNAAPDTSSSHARCPILQGDMWCATKFFYLKKVGDETNLSQSQTDDDANCTDEDENCSQWAAIGECQRNPVFMIGSPDYYGTCRKSCHACHQ